MDRYQAFVEYGRILAEADDWLRHGYRRDHDAAEVRPPIPPEVRSEPGPPETVDRVAGGADRSAPAPPAPGPNEIVPETEGSLEDIGSRIAECRKCNLYLLRETTVPGIGPAGATLMVVTPPPADAAGFRDSPLAPFEAEYLDKWLKALELDPRGDVFITPAVKCRTPGARPPMDEEQAACSGYLRKQYKAVRPRAVLALGGAACGALSGDPRDFPSLVGRDWTWGAVPALVLWTPAEVLANPGRLRKPVWDALQRLKAAWNAVPEPGL